MYHGRFKGTHYDAGYKYGSKLRKYGVVIKDSPTFEIDDEVKRFAQDCLPIYEEYYPEVVQEIKGMADGQGAPFAQLSELLFSIYCFKLQNHCTCFAISDGDHILFGRNSDFLVSLEKLNMNCLYRLDGVYAFNGNTTAFVQMEDGINEHGLAIGLTFIYPHIRKPGLNAGMLLRYVLEKCKTTEEAIGALRRLPTASAQTFTIADRDGKIAVVESNANHFEVIYSKPEECFVATANNFNSEVMQAYRTPLGVDDWRSDERYMTARSALQKNKSDDLLTFGKDLLAGKYGFMCQYDRKKNADTVWSVLYDITNSRIYRAEGNPSRKQFKEDKRMRFAD